MGPFRPAPQAKVVGLQIRRPIALAQPRRGQLADERLHDLAGDFILHGALAVVVHSGEFEFRPSLAVLGQPTAGRYGLLWAALQQRLGVLADLWVSRLRHRSTADR